MTPGDSFRFGKHLDFLEFHKHRRGLRAAPSRALGVALALALLAPPHAGGEEAQKKLIAVLEFRSKLAEADKADADAGYFSDVVRGQALDELPRARLMTRENMLVLLAAQGKELAGCEGECEVETGRKLGADFVISGELLKVGTSFKLDLKLHATASGELLAGAQASGKSVDELDAAVPACVKKLASPLLGQLGPEVKPGAASGLSRSAAPVPTPPPAAASPATSANPPPSTHGMVVQSLSPRGPSGAVSVGAGADRNPPASGGVASAGAPVTGSAAAGSPAAGPGDSPPPSQLHVRPFVPPGADAGTAGAGLVPWYKNANAQAESAPPAVVRPAAPAAAPRYQYIALRGNKLVQRTHYFELGQVTVRAGAMPMMREIAGLLRGPPPRASSAVCVAETKAPLALRRARQRALALRHALVELRVPAESVQAVWLKPGESFPGYELGSVCTLVLR